MPHIACHQAARTRVLERGAPARLACAALVLAAASGTTQAEDAHDYPKRRPGLWEIRSVGAQAAGLPPAQFCVGEHTDTPAAHLDRTVGERGACEFGPFRRAGAAWLAESVCREGRTVVSSRSVATGDFAHSYRIDTQVTYQPPLGGSKRDDKDALEARWLGPCARGQNPGDVVVPGMGTLNMIDGQFRAEPPPDSQPAGRRPRPRR